MKRLSMLLGLCCLLLAGCEPTTRADCFRDAAAIDFALATMADGQTPSPPAPQKCPRCKDTGRITHGDGHKTPCPDCQAGSQGPYGGPLDTLRQAKELIAKGNELADRKAFLMELDAAYCDVIVQRFEQFTGRKAERKAEEVAVAGAGQ